MKRPVRLIKKGDRDPTALAVEPAASPDPKEWSTSVKTWVKEFKEDQTDASLEAFDNLFSDSKR